MLDYHEGLRRIPRSIMIDQTNIAESRQQSRTIGLMTFLNQITLFLIGLSFSLQIERGQIVS